MQDAFLYVRGIATALFHAKSPDVGLLSRSGLEQIRLDEISRTDAGAQAVISALRCDRCDAISFRAQSSPIRPL